MRSEETGPVDTPLFNPEQHPRRINLGCGWDRREGYLNIDFKDFHQPDLLADVRDLHMLPSEFYDEIVAQDILEHLPRTTVLPTLGEWSRLLVTGGRLILRVPDVIGLANLLSQRRTLEEQETLLQNLYGTQAYTGDFHHFGFTELVLRHYLWSAGLECAELAHHDGWLFDVVAVRVPHPTMDLGDLRFMNPPGPTDQGDATGSVGDHISEDVHRALSEARQFTDPAPNNLSATRFRPAKAALLRVLRLITHRQRAHNAAIERAIEDLAKMLQAGDKPHE